MVTPTRMDGGMFFWFTQRDTTMAILVVHCENHQKGSFPRANELLIEASGCENVRKDVSRWDQTDDMETSAILELDTPIAGLNLDEMWIDVCAYDDVMGIGIGSNRIKRERAAWLALALSFDLTGRPSTNSLLLRMHAWVFRYGLTRAG